MKLKLSQGLIILLFIALSVYSCKKKTPAPTPVTPVIPVTPVVPDPPVVYPAGELAPITAPGYAGYELVWNDEFNDAALNTSKWNYETGTGVNGDFGTGQLDRATDRSLNVGIQNGLTNTDGGSLAITTRKEFFTDRQYTSGRINTKGKAAFGPGYRIEARIWARDIRYKGQGFAFWLMPDEVPAGQSTIMWPQGGEVDIMEYVGSIPAHNLGTVHYAWNWLNNTYADWNHGIQGGYYSYLDRQVPATKPAYGNWPPASADPNTGSSGYYIYRVEFFTDRLEFSINSHVYHIHYLKDGAAFDNGVADGQDKNNNVMKDGKRVFVSEYSNHFPEWKPFEHKFYMILSAGVGGNDNLTYGGAITPEAIFPCSTFIDWVRVYKKQ